jgi:hypothetical protein
MAAKGWLHSLHVTGCCCFRSDTAVHLKAALVVSGGIFLFIYRGRGWFDLGQDTHSLNHQRERAWSGRQQERWQLVPYMRG